MSVLILEGARMRINADAKEATRRRILETARGLFDAKGFDQASTRDLARAAGIAAGTLFNYFPTKEAIAMTLVAEALAEGREDCRKKARAGASLDEDLFAFVAAQLRRLKPHRAYLEPVLGRALSPLAHAAAAPEGESMRVAHLETVGELLHKHGRADEPSFVALHLYWTLFTGVLAFWSQDGSRHQEDTLAVLDRALQMFVRSLPAPEASHEP
jgi:AcrR family transcriptional regulator